VFIKPEWAVQTMSSISWKQFQPIDLFKLLKRLDRLKPFSQGHGVLS
jgi:hypothetical protein